MGSTKAFGIEATRLLVLVNPSNNATVLTKDQVAELFLKKRTVWPDGRTAQPVDLNPESPVRAVFSQTVLERTLMAVRSYWQQRIFSGGDIPPPDMATEDDVVSYVRKHAGAVGYISETTPHDGTKILEVR